MRVRETEKEKLIYIKQLAHTVVVDGSSKSAEQVVRLKTSATS